MTDDPGHAWLDEHRDRAEDLIYCFYALAGLSAIAIFVPIKWPKSSVPLALVVLFTGRCDLSGWEPTSHMQAEKFGTKNFETSRHHHCVLRKNTSIEQSLKR